MISPFVELMRILFWWSLDMVFPWKSSCIREKRWAPALEQNFMGHRVWTQSYGIVVCYISWCTRISNQFVLCEHIECVTVHGAHYTSLGGLCNIFHEPNFLFFIFLFILHHQQTQHFIITIPTNGFFCILNFFIIIAILSFVTILTLLPFSPAMLAYSIEFLCLFSFFCFLIFFFFLSLFSGYFLLPDLWLYLPHLWQLLTLLIIGFKGLFSVFSSFCF